MITSPIRPRHQQEQGIAAGGQLARQRTPYGASLSFATTTHLRLPPDTPSRKPTGPNKHRQTARSIPTRALASSVLDSPRRGSRPGLPPPISTPCQAHRSARPYGPRSTPRSPNPHKGVNSQPAPRGQLSSGLDTAPRRGCRENPWRARWIACKGGLRKRPSRPVTRWRPVARASCTAALRCTSASLLRVFSSSFSRQPPSKAAVVGPI